MATERASNDIRGRVAVRMRGGKASPLVLQVAVRVAHTFRGELHGLFFEHEDLMALARMPFGREISLTGTRSRPISPETVEAEMHEALRAMEQRFTQLREGLNLPTRFEVLHSAEERSKQALRNIGILAIGEPIALAAPETFLSILADLPSLAGIVVTGSGARRAEGPVVAVIEPGSNIGMLVDTAEKISGESGQETVLLIVTADSVEAAQLEAEARKSLDTGTRYRMERVHNIEPGSLSAFTRRMSAGLVIARAGGTLAGDGSLAARYACALDCPLLLLK